MTNEIIGGMVTNGLLGIIAYILKSMHEDFKKLRVDQSDMKTQQSIIKHQVDEHEKRIIKLENN